MKNTGVMGLVGLTLGLSVALSACGKEDNAPHVARPSKPANLAPGRVLPTWSGNYAGTLSGAVAGTPITNTTLAMTLYQTGKNINGYWIATGASGTQPDSGQIQGVVSDSGDTLTATLTIPAGEEHTGSLTGMLTLSDHQLSGSVSGVVKGTDSLTATLSLTLSQ